MGKVVELFCEKSFDPDTIRVMSAAYEMARESLHDRGQPDIVNEIIAKRIIALAAVGQRDVVVLAEKALEALGPDAIRRQG